MNVDQLGHGAAQATHDAARQMPLRPIDQIAGGRRRRSWIAALAGLGTVVVAIIIAVSLTGPSDQAPVATDPTGVPQPSVTTTTAVSTASSAGAATDQSASSTTAVAVTPVIPQAGISEPIVWFDGFAVGTGAPGSAPTTLAERQGDNFGLKMIADDGAGGFVTLVDGSFEWWRAGSSEPLTVQVAVDDESLNVSRLLQVVRLDGAAYADVLFSRDGDDVCSPMRGFVDLDDGTVPQGVITAAGPLFGLRDGWVITDCFNSPPTILAGGLAATLDGPEYTDLDPESGAPLSPIPVTQVVVTDPGGAEVVRVDVTTDEQPFAVLHDFDGRYVLVSREGWEPALAARTFFVIDTGCADCGLGEAFTTGTAASADMGARPASACDLAAGIATQVAPPSDVPEAVLSQWSALFVAIGACDYRALDEITGEAPMVSHAAPELPGWEGAAELRPSLLVDVYDALVQVPSERDGTWYFPGYMNGRRYSELTPESQGEAERVLAEAWGGAQSGFATFGAWFDDAGSGAEYPGVIVEFRSDGTILVSSPVS